MLFNKCYYDDQIKENWMTVACVTDVRDEKCMKNVTRKSCRKRWTWML